MENNKLYVEFSLTFFEMDEYGSKKEVKLKHNQSA